jgi:UDP-N-acetylglucosamine:LPS N-acetylglucosamine transferase
MKFLFLAEGLGEVVQGVAVAQYARKRGIESKFINTIPTCHKYVKELGFKSVLLPNLPQIKIREWVNKSIEECAPDVIFCCNSKTTKQIFLPKKELNSLIVSLDSNWLFESMPTYFDRFFVCFPKKIFEINRNYKITDPRVKPVGFIPSGYDLSEEDIFSVRKERRVKAEKLIFSYFGRGITFRDFLIDKLLKAVAEFNLGKSRAKLILLSDREVEREDVISIKWLKSDRDFNRYLAASDCIVCHHGMPTISKAILAKVPVISFVPDVLEGIKPSETCEVEPFEELGLCIWLPYSASPRMLKEALNQVIFGKKGEEIRKKQSKYLIKGEEVILAEISGLLKKKRKASDKY